VVLIVAGRVSCIGSASLHRKETTFPGSDEKDVTNRYIGGKSFLGIGCFGSMSTPSPLTQDAPKSQTCAYCFPMFLSEPSSLTYQTEIHSCGYSYYFLTINK
jgi:hypothetical protein